MGEIINKPVLREGDFNQLTLLTLRVAYVAHPDVIAELSNFAKALRAAVTGPNAPEDTEDDEQGKQITRAERRRILFAFSEVSQLIRQDLIESPVKTETIQDIIENFSKAGEIANTTADGSMITEENNNQEVPVETALSSTESGKIQPTKMTFAHFLNQCQQPGEREFFERFMPLLQTNKFVPLWTQKGFSIEKTIRFHPSEQIFPKWRSYIERPALTKRREKVEAALAAAGVNISFSEKPDLRFDWEQMKNATPEAFLEVVKAVLR